MLLSLLALTAAAQSWVGPGCGQIVFSRTGALARTSELVCVGRDPEGPQGHYLLRRTSTDESRAPTVSWVRTVNCPAAMARLETFERLPLPRPDLNGYGDELQEIVVDGASYRLTTHALYGGSGADLDVTSNIGTPLALWIDDTLAALRPCWRRLPNAD